MAGTTNQSGRKVRYAGSFDDPTLDDDEYLVMYYPDEPPETTELLNVESEEVRSIELVDSVYLGEWMTESEAIDVLREMNNPFDYEDQENGGDGDDV